MVRLALLALFVAAGYSLGTALWWPAKRLVTDGWRRRLLFRLALGLGALAYLVFGLGLLGWLRPAAAWALLLGALLVGAPALWAEERARRRFAERAAATSVQFARVERWPHWRDGGRWPLGLGWATLVLLGLLAGAAAVIALAPPIAYDDLTYHLAAPKIYARAGRVEILPYDHHTAFPFTLEMLYTLALLVGDDSLARLVQMVFWGLALLAVYTLGRDHFGPRAGWLAILVYATTPLGFWEAGTAYNEFGFGCYQLLAWLALLEYLNHRVTAVSAAGAEPQPSARQPAWLAVAGLMAGLTVGCKLTGGLLVVFLAGVVVVLGWVDRLSGRTVRVDLLTLLVSSGVFAGPWLARTWIATGDPFFPFGQRVFHSPLWSDERAADYAAAQAAFGQALDAQLRPVEADPYAHRRWWRLPGLPWRLTFHPEWFFDRGYGFDGRARFGPAWLAFGPPALLAWLVLLARRRRHPLPSYRERREEATDTVWSPEFGREITVPRSQQITEEVELDVPRAAGLLLAYLGFVGLFWFATMQYSRYLLPHLALLAVLAGWAADGLFRLRLAAVAAAVVIGVHLAAGGAFALAYTFPALQVALGGMDAESYAAASTPAYGAMQWINANTPPEAKVALYGEPRGYWLDRDYLWGETGHHTMIPDEVRRDADTYVDFLHDRLGVTHVLVFLPVVVVADRPGDDEGALLGRAAAAGRLELVWRNPRGTVAVFEVRATGATPLPDR